MLHGVARSWVASPRHWGQASGDFGEIHMQLNLIYLVCANASQSCESDFNAARAGRSHQIRQ
jgi:hypothetical protein